MDELPQDKWFDFVVSRDQGLRNEIVNFYLSHAKNVAIRVYALRRDNSVDFEDYVQYARLGLLEAVDSFDPSKGASFPTFSGYRIRGAILNGLAKQSELAAQRSYWAARQRDRLNSLKHSHSESEESDSLERMVQLTVDLALGFVLDKDQEDLRDQSRRASPYTSAVYLELAQHVAANMAILPERERDLLQQHYFEHIDFKAIAEAWGISKGRISQLHAQALGRLRVGLFNVSGVDREL